MDIISVTVPAFSFASLVYQKDEEPDCVVIENTKYCLDQRVIFRVEDSELGLKGDRATIVEFIKYETMEELKRDVEKETNKEWILEYYSRCNAMVAIYLSLDWIGDDEKSFLLFPEVVNVGENFLVMFPFVPIDCSRKKSKK